ncbi:hypothetical protein HDU83_001515 [Entophlyctis luteolus]|nr:hypothetical protein HDU83_001515 [Entophlyctis luteolus]
MASSSSSSSSSSVPHPPPLDASLYLALHTMHRALFARPQETPPISEPPSTAPPTTATTTTAQTSAQTAAAILVGARLAGARDTTAVASSASASAASAASSTSVILGELQRLMHQPGQELQSEIQHLPFNERLLALAQNLSKDPSTATNAGSASESLSAAPILRYPLNPLHPSLKRLIDDMLEQRITRSANALGLSIFAADPAKPPVPDPSISAHDAHQLLGPEYHPSRRGAPCGHVFEEGDGVYMCRNCALDETCVMCQPCFHASDHEGHDTTFHISQGGGCCDCGDLQAWRVPVICKFHTDDSTTASKSSSFSDPFKSAEKPDIPVPEDVVADIRSTISTVLDFIIDTFNSSPTDFSLPTSLTTIIDNNKPEPGDEDCCAVVDTTNAESGDPASSSVTRRDMFACILWNDEEHMFDEVIMKVQRAINCIPERASQVAVNVDSVGREVIATSYQLPRLLSIARSINEDRGTSGLNVTIRTVRDTFRENLAGYLVSWVRDLAARVRGRLVTTKDGIDIVHASIVLVVRSIVCEELCAPRRKVKEALLSSLLGSEFHDRTNNFASGLIDSDGDVNMYDSSVAKTENIRWRLDYLIGFDSRLWKELRAAMKGLYIESLIISGDHYKRALALRFTYTYPIMANSFLILDREYDLSMMTFTVQLFTVPTIAEYLLKNTSIMHCLFATLKAFFLSDHYESDFHEPVFPYHNLLKSIKRANALFRPTYAKLTFEQHNDRVYKKQKYSHIFNDIKYFLTTPPVRMNLFRNGSLAEFAGFLDLCRVMQGMYPQKRHIRTHVEYESQAWTNSFYLGANLSRVLEHIGDAFAPTRKSNLQEDLHALTRAIKLCLKVLDDWCAQEQLQEFQEWDERIASASRPPFTHPIRSLDGFIPITYCGLQPAHRVLDFKALGRSLSLHTPIHWVLAKLLSCLPYYGVELGAKSFSLKDFLTIEDVMEPKPKDLSDLSFVQDLDNWNAGGDDVDRNVTLPPPLVVPPLLQQISQEDHIARIFDHPLRAEVFLSQIRVGLWVRNGFSMRTQLSYFKFLLLRDMYDLDVFLLQSFAVFAGPDRFITTLLDRYDIRAWFEANPVESAKKFLNEPGPSIALAEDLLNLLVNVVTERARISAMSVEDQAIREVIHVLATSGSVGLPYSKIAELIPYEITRLLQGLPVASSASMLDGDGDKYYFQPCRSIEGILAQVATFKPPLSSSDKGLYELKDEYFDHIDPWFHHYTRTQREEVDAILGKRIVKKYGGLVGKLLAAAKTGSLNGKVSTTHSGWSDMNRLANSYGQFLPRIVEVKAESGFGAIDLFVAGKSFTLLLLMALHNLTRSCKSDHAIAAIVHFLLVAVEVDLQRDPSLSGPRFIDQAAVVYHFEVLGKPTSLIGIVLRILDGEAEDAFKDHIERLSLFIIRVAAYGSCPAMDQIVSWQNAHVSLQKAVLERDGSGSVTPALSEKELRKEESKRRQAAIMAKFAAQQQTFIDGMQDESDDEEADAVVEDMSEDKATATSSYLPESRSWNFPEGNCIMCQEEFTKDRLYGMLCFSQPCYIERSRFVDFRDPSSVLSAINAPSLNEPVEFQSGVSFTDSSGGGGSRSLYQKFPRAEDFNPTREQRDAKLYTSSCGHMMHSSCFELYFSSIENRQQQEHRLYAESVERGEFLCPLCKSLGNIMLPIRNISKTETINWSGCSDGVSDGGQPVPGGKNGEKNCLTGLQGWFDTIKPRLADVIDKRAKMQTDDLPSPGGLAEPATEGSSTGNRRTSSASKVGGQRPLIERVMNVLTRDIASNRRASDASILSQDGEPHDQSELQDLIDRLMTPLIRLTDDCLTNGLLYSLEYTILSLERSVRADSKQLEVGNSNSGLIHVQVLEQLNSSTLVFLRVFSEAILQLNEYQNSTDDFDKGVYPDANTDLQIFFAGMDPMLYPKSSSFVPQLAFTGFSTLVGITFANDDPQVCENEDDIFKWVGLSWCSEVVRTIVAVIKSIAIHGDQWHKNDSVLKAAYNVTFGAESKEVDVKGKGPMIVDNQMMDVEFGSSLRESEMARFLSFIVSHMDLSEDAAASVLDILSPALIYSLVRAVSLPFMRCAAIYMYARFYLVPAAGSSGFGHRLSTSRGSLSEFEELRLYLQLPTIWQLCSTTTVADPFLSKLFGNWISGMNGQEAERKVNFADQIAKAVVPGETYDTYRIERAITVETPAALSLITLPSGLENLFADCFRKVCNNCQKTISDPALCLICGTLVCALSFCCLKDKKGECNNHIKRCSGDIGLFFMVKRFKILLLHNEKGCYMDPPYLDVHGEVDVNRRKGSRQFLHLKRYSDINKMWLTHGLPSYVARIVESVHSYGGWGQY